MLDPIIGEHPTLRRIKERLPALAASGETILVIGEHGTGKTLLAKTIHSKSPFSKNKLITIDCSLLEDRDQILFLFGSQLSHTISQCSSPLELSTTIVIKNPEAGCDGFKEDLVNALATRMVLNTKSGRRVPINARLIFTLNKPLSRLAIKTQLEQKLIRLLRLYQTITLPSLAKRKLDIPLLASYFIKLEAAKRSNGELRGVDRRLRPTTSLVSLMKSHPWKHNIWELKGFIRSLVIETPDELIEEKEHRALDRAIVMIDEKRAFRVKNLISQIESSLVSRTLDRNENKVLTSSFLLGMSRTSIRRHARQ